MKPANRASHGMIRNTMNAPSSAPDGNPRNSRMTGLASATASRDAVLFGAVGIAHPGEGEVRQRRRADDPQGHLHAVTAEPLQHEREGHRRAPSWR